MCPTPSAKRRLAGINRKASAPTCSRKNSACFLDREALRHFERRPEPVTRTRRNGIRRADDDVARERIRFRHELERGRRACLRGSARRRARRARGSSRATSCRTRADHTCAQHRADAIDRRFEIDAGLFGDRAEGVAQKPRDAIFGDAEDRGVDRILDGDGTLNDRHERFYVQERLRIRFFSTGAASVRSRIG